MAVIGDADVAGFHIVRRLGSGSRADVFLARDPASERDDSPPVVLKVFRPGADMVSAAAEIAVLSSIEAVCLPRLDDVVTLRGGAICLVLERLAGPTLAHRLSGRASVAPGEAVTILAPLVTTMGAMHAGGWVVGALTASAMRFDASGRVVLTSMRAARSLSDETPPHAAEHRRADYLLLAAFVDAVVGATAAAPSDIAVLLRNVASTRPLVDPLPDVEALLFAWARPEPIVFTVGGPDPDSVPNRIDVPGLAPITGEEDGSAAPFDRAPSRHEPLAGAPRGMVVDLAGRVAGLLDAGPFSTLRVRLAGFIHRHRRPVIAFAILGVLVTGLAVSVLPSDEGPKAPSTAAVPTRSPASSSPGPTVVDPAILGDEPVAAATALLAERARCFRVLEVACLARVDQDGSPLAEADAHAVAAGSPDAFQLGVGSVTLVERTGDAALVILAGSGGPETPPASLLLMKGEAGWRLREVFDR